jgi:hypothetical protein
MISDRRAGSRPCAAHGQGLAGAEHVHGKQHVVAGLGDLPGAGGTGMESSPGPWHREPAAPLEHGGVAAAHEGQRAGLRRGHAAGDRRVEKADAALRRRLTHLRAVSRIDRRAVEDRRRRGQRFEQAVVAEIEAGDVLAGGQHGDEEVAPAAASAAEPATAAPASASASQASATGRNRSRKTGLEQVAAMGPPMLPSPMKTSCSPCCFAHGFFRPCCAFPPRGPHRSARGLLGQGA